MRIVLLGLGYFECDFIGLVGGTRWGGVGVGLFTGGYGQGDLLWFYLWVRWVWGVLRCCSFWYV